MHEDTNSNDLQEIITQAIEEIKKEFQDSWQKPFKTDGPYHPKDQGTG